MYQYNNQWTIAYPDSDIKGKNHLKLKTNLVKYIEIGSLYGGS